MDADEHTLDNTFAVPFEFGDLYSFAPVDVTTPTATGERHNARSLAAFGAADGRHQWTAAGFDLGGGSRSGSMFGWSYEYPAVTSADLDQDRQPGGRAGIGEGGGMSAGRGLRVRVGAARLGGGGGAGSGANGSPAVSASTVEAT